MLMGPLESFFDHSVPICSLLDIPLICTSPQLLFKLKHFYPPFAFKLIPELALEHLIKDYSSIFYGFSIYPHTFREQINQKIEEKDNLDLWEKPTQFIYHLHGCSDKHWFQPVGHLSDTDQILVYGERMLDIFKSSGFDERATTFSKVGNYRLTYYQKHKDFFDASAEKNIFSKFEKKQLTLLYAPTWHDKDDSSSVLKALGDLIENLPRHINLLVKLHPLLKMDMEQKGSTKKLSQLLEHYLNKPNLQVSFSFPHIYSLLNKVDVYLGDYSSVGYDALYFNIPLFFLNHDDRNSLADPSAYLLKAGHNLHLKDLKNIYSNIEKELPLDSLKYSKIRKQIYEYAFGKDLPYQEVVQNYQNILTGY